MHIVPTSQMKRWTWEQFIKCYPNLNNSLRSPLRLDFNPTQWDSVPCLSLVLPLASIVFVTLCFLSPIPNLFKSLFRMSLDPLSSVRLCLIFPHRGSCSLFCFYNIVFIRLLKLSLCGLVHLAHWTVLVAIVNDCWGNWLDRRGWHYPDSVTFSK